MVWAEIEPRKGDTGIRSGRGFLKRHQYPKAKAVAPASACPEKCLDIRSSTRQTEANNDLGLARRTTALDEGGAMRTLLVFAVTSLLASAASAAETLDIYVIDTEGGKAVILRTPEGETMLVDAGYPTQDDRDTKRIVRSPRTPGSGSSTMSSPRTTMPTIAATFPGWTPACRARSSWTTASPSPR